MIELVSEPAYCRYVMHCRSSATKTDINQGPSKTEWSLWSSEPQRGKTLIILRQTASEYRGVRTKTVERLQRATVSKGGRNPTGPRVTMQKGLRSDVYENETVIVKALRTAAPTGALRGRNALRFYQKPRGILLDT